MPAYDKTKKDETAALVEKRLKLSEEYVQPYFERFLDNYKHYFIHVIDEAVKADPNAYPFYSQMMLPISYQIVETLLPRMLSKLPSFSIKTEEENDEASEIGLKELIRYQMNHPYLLDYPVFLRLADFLKECFITGNAVGVVPWVKKKVKVSEWQPSSRMMGLPPSWDMMNQMKAYGIEPDWEQVEVEKTLIDSPVFDYRSIFHFYPDPKKSSPSTMKYGMFKEMMTMDEIMEMVDLSPREYQNIDDLKKLKAMKNSSRFGTRNWDQELAGIFNSDDFATRDETDGQYEVLEMREADKLCIVVNRKITIRESDNPNRDGKIGVVFMKDVPVPNQLYGWGEIDSIKRIEDMMSDQANMRVDNVIRSMLRMWKVNPNGMVDGEEFIPEPDTVVQVTDMNAIEPIDVQDVTASTYKEGEWWQRVVQNVTGITDYATGSSDPSMNKTMGGVELLQQAANARFAFKLQLFEHLALKAIGTLYVNRNLQFFDTPQSVPTEKGKQLIKPEMLRALRGTIHFIVDSGSTEAVNRQTELAKWQDILNRLEKALPPFNNLDQSSYDYAARRYLTAMGETNPEQLLKRVPIQMTNPALAAAMGMGTGMGGGVPGNGSAPNLPATAPAPVGGAGGPGYPAGPVAAGAPAAPGVQGA